MHFYCQLCNMTFSKLFDPDEINYGGCPYCNKNFIEPVDRLHPYPIVNNTIPRPQVQPEPHVQPHYYQEQSSNQPQQHHMPQPNHYHGHHSAPEPNYMQYEPYYSMPRGHYGHRRGFCARRHHRPHVHFMPRPIPSPFPFGSIGLPFDMHGNQVFYEEEKMPFGFPVDFMPPIPFVGGFDFPSLFNNFQPYFFPDPEIDMHDIMENMLSNYQPYYAPEAMQPEEGGRPPTAQSVLDSMKPFKCETKHAKKSEDGKLEYPGCTICFSNMALGENCIMLPCGHMYHADCIKPWLTKNNTCPVCRYELPSDNSLHESQRRQNSRRRGHGRIRRRRY